MVYKYFDGTLTTGDNDGTSWANAYQGFQGLIDGFGWATRNQDTTCYLRNTFTMPSMQEDKINLTAPSSIDYLLNIVGCDSAGVPLTVGNYVEIIYDDDEDMYTGSALFTDDYKDDSENGSYITIENIRFQPEANKYLFTNGCGNEGRLVLKNCKTNLIALSTYDTQPLITINGHHERGAYYNIITVLNSYISITGSTEENEYFCLTNNYSLNIDFSILVMENSNSYIVGELITCNNLTVTNSTLIGIQSNSAAFANAPTCVLLSNCIYYNILLTNMYSNMYAKINCLAATANDFVSIALRDYRLKPGSALRSVSHYLVAHENMNVSNATRLNAGAYQNSEKGSEFSYAI